MGLEEPGTENYEVFLSFRGPDTRQGFTDVLYDHMIRAGIRVFIDNNELAIGDQINKIFMAINNSQICVPIFSKTFAQSEWCLKEVGKMVELNKVVLPIFYDVTPADVKQMLDNEPGQVPDWASALKAIAQIKGREVKHNGYVDFCKSFVVDVLYKLKPAKRYNIDPLVGIDDQLESAMALLDVESDGVRYTSIHGMGGIGKTTLAKTIFNKISSRFKYSSFLENIRECSSGPEGVENLRRKLNDSLDPTSSSSRSRGIHERFCNGKLLLILDDVDKMEQIKELIGDSSWLGSGSRIIVTTRCMDVLTEYATLYEELEVHQYEMRPLEDDMALQLFSRHAFGKASPPADFSDLSEKVVFFAGGLPLALRVIGSSLCKKKKDVWEDVIARLKRIPTKEVKDKLRISYDALEHDHKQIFLDIACFFRSSIYALYFWESCGWFPQYGLAVLESRFLIKIVENNKILMHDQLRDLGKDIVREESIQNPAKRSRLRTEDGALEVLMSRDPGKQMVQVLFQGEPLVNTLTDEHLGDFQDIRCLGLRGGNFKGKMKDLLGNLRWLQWYSTPANFNLGNFSVKKLVILDLSYSSVDENWDGWIQIQMAINLKVLDLENCHRLTRTPDFAENHSMERLNLSRCSRLATIGSSIRNLRRLKFLDLRYSDSLRAFPEELCSLTELQEILMRVSLTTSSLSSPDSIGFKTIPNSVGDLKSLILLDLSGCWGLCELPDSIGRLVKLKELWLGGCVRLEKLPDSLWQLISLVHLDLSSSQISDLPDSVGDLQELQLLNIRDCSNITRLPTSIGRLKKLVELDARWCLKLEEIPVEIGDLSCLRRLELAHAAIRTLPSTICRLSLLKELNVEMCRQLQELPELPPGLTELRVPAGCMKSLHDQSQLDIISCLTIDSGHDLEAIQRFPTKLKTLRWCLSESHTLPFDLSSLSQLENLSFSKNHAIPNSRLPFSLSGLKNLSYLQLLNFSEGEDAGLESLGARDMENLRSVMIFKCSCYVIELCLARTLTDLHIDECISLSKLPDLSNLKALRYLLISHCPGLTEILDLEELESLSTLSITHCSSIKRIGDLSKLKKLLVLYIEGCHELTQIEGIDKLNINELNIINCPRWSSIILLENSRGLMETLFRWSTILLGLVCLKIC